jgi:hypothetical protein
LRENQNETEHTHSRKIIAKQIKQMRKMTTNKEKQKNKLNIGGVQAKIRRKKRDDQRRNKRINKKNFKGKIRK